MASPIQVFMQIIWAPGQKGFREWMHQCSIIILFLMEILNLHRLSLHQPSKEAAMQTPIPEAAI